MKVLVLGSGMVGSAMAQDLLNEPGWQVTVADRDAGALARLAERARAAGRAAALTTLHEDLGDAAAVGRLAAGHDLVLGALASVLGLQTLRAVLEAGRPYVDISFMADDALALDDLAKARGVCAVVDCGVAPGMSNMLCGYAASVLSPCTHLEIYVGGLPVDRRWPYEYKAPFAPHDVLEEYTRPARIVERGEIVIKEALSEPEYLEFPGIGTLEAFNTDGLRSLAYTLKVPSMKEKTMRYPGHIALMRVLRETGFFSKEPIEVRAAPSPEGGAAGKPAAGKFVVAVRPLDVTAALLFPKWTFEEGEADLTVMRVSAEGSLDGRRVRKSWDLFDRYDPVTRTRSMSRTTGFPATIVARLIASGRFKRPGVHPPETLGAEPGLLGEVLAQLKARGIHYTAKTEMLA
ncbi:MAG: saccharopine dehydrogenase family protein [Planctomycetota bacterium]